MAQNQNQFAQTVEKGSVTLDPNFATFNVAVSVNEAATLVPAQAVLLEDAVNKQIPVIKVAATGDAIFGFITRNIRINEYKAEDQVKVATSGDVMVMEASAAVARGAALEVVVTGSKVATQSAGTTIGTALDKAAADGDLIRVLIKL